MWSCDGLTLDSLELKGLFLFIYIFSPYFSATLRDGCSRQLKKKLSKHQKNQTEQKCATQWCQRISDKQQRHPRLTLVLPMQPLQGHSPWALGLWLALLAKPRFQIPREGEGGWTLPRPYSAGPLSSLPLSQGLYNQSRNCISSCRRLPVFCRVHNYGATDMLTIWMGLAQRVWDRTKYFRQRDPQGSQFTEQFKQLSQ